MYNTQSKIGITGASGDLGANFFTTAHNIYENSIPIFQNKDSKTRLETRCNVKIDNSEEIDFLQDTTKVENIVKTLDILYHFAGIVGGTNKIQIIRIIFL